MTNNERFNIVLNVCQNSRAVYAALLELRSAGILDELRKEYGKSVQVKCRWKEACP